MKKLLSIVICLIICLSVVPLSASALSSDIMWTQISESTAQITFYTGMEKNVVIPTKIEGFTVTEISGSAFYGATIESITLPSKLEYIGDWAFNSSSLKSIKIPNTVKEIGEKAFEGCTALESVTIGNGLTEISEKAFYGCTSLKTLKIGNKVRDIDKEAFRMCSSLKTLTLPDSVKKVEEHAFADCTALKTINIGKGLKEIEEYAFCDTTNIEYFGNPSKAKMDKLWKQNVRADVYIHIKNKAAQKHFKSLKKGYLLKHLKVGKTKAPTFSAICKNGIVKMNWSKVAGAKSYKVTVAPINKTYTVKGTSLTVKKLLLGYSYSFKVKANIKGAKTSKTIKLKIKQGG